MVDLKRNCAGAKNPNQESGSSISSSSCSYECKCQRSEGCDGLRGESRGRTAQYLWSARLVVLLIFLWGFLCGFVVCIECWMWNSDVNRRIDQMKDEVQLLKEALMELKKQQQNYETNDLVPIHQLTLQHQQQQLSRMKRDDEDGRRADKWPDEKESKKDEGGRSRRHNAPLSKRQIRNGGKKHGCNKHTPAFHVTMPALPGTIYWKDEPTLASAEDGVHKSPTYIYGSWSATTNSSKDFALVRGNSIRVKRQGLYFVYSQILFHSAAAVSSYRIYADADGELARCFTSVDQVKENSTQAAENARYKTCYTGTIVFLKSDQLLQLRSDYNHSISRLTNSNFFGLFRISA